VTKVDDFLLGPAKPVLWTMLAGAALMVLLACASVAALQLFRSARQDQSLAVQLALGASRARLIRRSLFESLLLAGAATAAAIVVTWVVTRVLVEAAPLDVPRLSTSSMRASAVLLAMVMLTTAAGLLTGLWPAVFIRQVDPSRVLVTGGRTAMHPRQRFLQRIIVASQVCVAIVILAGAGLFVRSVGRLDRTALGFNPKNLTSIDAEPSFEDATRWDQFFDAFLAEVRQVPGAAAAAAVYLRPLSGPIGNDTIPLLTGQSLSDNRWRSNARANLEAVTPGYFHALGTRVVTGRDFTRDDRADSEGVVIVSVSAARRYWPDRDPIGERILVPTQRVPGTLEEPRWQTVVGVVEDIRYRGIRDPRLDVYLPAAQSTAEVKQVIVRTEPRHLITAAGVRAIAQKLDPAVHIGEVVTMENVLARETAPWRFAMQVLTGFGIFGALVATVGLTGLVSLVVALRERELGIRAALGATPARLQRHVATEGLLTIAGGSCVGLLIALALGRLIAALLVDTPPHDPISLGGAAAVTLVTGLAGCLLPASRAARREPADTLRT
jgi:predicted permease